ncbi:MULTISPECIES: helix-turn-helix domain-containing protein [unclassified Myroides]|uniref:helix-turn-helix domain-containing protein n=1 Tax=unclassified Myroides TaxID=2642485 RepID=UPI003D2F88A6
MNFKKNDEMKLEEWNFNLQIDRYYFLLFVFFSLLLSSSCYFVLVAHKTASIVNLYAIVFSLKLFRMAKDGKDGILKTQILQIASLAVLLIVLSFLWVPLWIVVALNNFFAVVYFVVYYGNQKEFKEQSTKIGAYIYIVHFFFVVNLCLLNAQLYLMHHKLSSFILVVKHVQVGIQGLILMISLFTYAILTKKEKEVEKKTFSVLVSARNGGAKDGGDAAVAEVTEVDRYQLKYKNQELGDQILDFFETRKDFLQRDFSLDMLCSSIPNCTTQQASFVLNHYLNTTFYKLVAYHRIIYSLQLLVNQPDWTILAIAEECGFRSVNTFTKYFKNLTGFSPVDYRGVIEKSKAKV